MMTGVSGKIGSLRQRFPEKLAHEGRVSGKLAHCGGFRKKLALGVPETMVHGGRVSEKLARYGRRFRKN